MVTQSARQTVLDVRICHDVYWSDHLPLIIECDLNIVIKKVQNVDDIKKKSFGVIEQTNKSVDIMNCVIVSLKRFVFRSFLHLVEGNYAQTRYINRSWKMCTKILSLSFLNPQL